jgi:hypothetical protein
MVFSFLIGKAGGVKMMQRNSIRVYLYLSTDNPIEEFKLHETLFETLSLGMPETLKAIKSQLQTQVAEKLAA